MQCNWHAFNIANSNYNNTYYYYTYSGTTNFLPTW
jgi:hypothetical protein